MPFTFTKCEIPEVILIEAKTFDDDRGFFRETFKNSDFVANGIDENFVQENFSHSIKDTLRGLHYQKNPDAQGKLVSVLQGEVLDVAVDIRQGSPHYGKSVSVVLNRENANMLYVPAGFAHGFLVLSEKADVFYKVTKEYSPTNDAGVLWNDKDMAIDWGIDKPLLSEKDIVLPALADIGSPFIYKPQ